MPCRSWVIIQFVVPLSPTLAMRVSQFRCASARSCSVIVGLALLRAASQKTQREIHTNKVKSILSNPTSSRVAEPPFFLPYQRVLICSARSVVHVFIASLVSCSACFVRRFTCHRCCRCRLGGFCAIACSSHRDRRLPSGQSVCGHVLFSLLALCTRWPRRSFNSLLKSYSCL